jgi:hypothetical protein
VGLLRGYGNAIVPQVAAEFVMAYLDTTGLIDAGRKPLEQLPSGPETRKWGQR